MEKKPNSNKKYKPSRHKQTRCGKTSALGHDEVAETRSSLLTATVRKTGQNP